MVRRKGQAGGTCPAGEPRAGDTLGEGNS